jgi:hypothetical protein
VSGGLARTKLALGLASEPDSLAIYEKCFTLKDEDPRLQLGGTPNIT